MGESEFEKTGEEVKKQETSNIPAVLIPKEVTPQSYSLEEKIMASDRKNNIQLEVVLSY